MPTITINWDWEEAFDKFGFGDGDGLVMTDEVEAFIQSLGYETDSDVWGCHNVVIRKVAKDGRDYCDGIDVGYDDPRTYLPADLVAALDAKFGGAA